MNIFKFKHFCCTHENPNGRNYFSKKTFAYNADVKIGWWNKSNFFWIKTSKFFSRTNTQELKFSVKTDQFGFRISATEKALAFDRPILLCGESNFWGQGLEYEETISGILVRKKGLPVCNASLIAISGVQAFFILEKFKKLRPRAFVFGMLDGSLFDNISQCSCIDSPICFERPFIKLTNKSTKIKLIKNSTKNLKKYLAWYRRDKSKWFGYYLSFCKEQILQKVYPERRTGGFNFDSLKPDIQKNALQGLRFLCQNFRQTAGDSDLKLIFCYLPIFSQLTAEISKMKIKQIVEEYDIKWLDLEPVLSLPGQKKINPEFIFPLDGHLNAAGHALVADALASRLNELL